MRKEQPFAKFLVGRHSGLETMGNTRICARKDATINKGGRTRNPKSANGRGAAAFGSPATAIGLLRLKQEAKRCGTIPITTPPDISTVRLQPCLLPQRFLDYFKKSL